MNKETKIGPVKRFLKLSGITISLFWNFLKDSVYNIEVSIYKKRAAKNNTAKISAKNRNRLFFYIAMLAIPVIQFCIFYIYVNVNSIFLAFVKFDYYSGTYSWMGFNNIISVLNDINTLPILQSSLKNSLLSYIYTFAAGITLALIFSYYIFKKSLFSGFFKVILFMPQIISSVVLVIMFKYFTENAIPELAKILFNKQISGLLYEENTKFATLLFFTIWAGFGTQILLYSGAMGGISVSIIESADLDGCNFFREFWSIILPLIYPTIVTFIIVGIAGLFTNQMNLFSFFGQDASFNVYTFGYYFYKMIQSNSTTIAQYPYLAAMGIILTMVSAPITLVAKWLLEKFGPSMD